jgi:hypothetical protein
MSTTTIETSPVRAFRRLKDAFVDMNYARRRRLELRTELAHDYRNRAEIEHLEALMRFKPRI